MSLDMGKLMRQAQKLQEEVERVQRDLAERTVEATAGGGIVRAKVTCDKRLVELVLDKEVVNPSDIDMLQDLIIAAVNEAIRIAEETAAAEMKKVAGGLGLPGLPGGFGRSQ